MSNGNSFTFDSIDFGGTLYNLYVNRYPNVWLAEPSLNVTPLGGGNGAIVQGSTFEPMILSVGCIVIGTSEADLLTKMGRITTALKKSQTEGAKTLKFDLHTAETYTVRLSSEIRTDERGKEGVSFDLEFIVPSGAAN